MQVDKQADQLSEHVKLIVTELIGKFLDRLFLHEHGQIIPDTMATVLAFPMLGRRFFSTGVFDLQPRQHGLNANLSNHAPALEHVLQELSTLRCTLSQELWSDISRNPQPWNALYDQGRFHILEQIVDILLEGTRQVSFAFFRNILAYASHAALLNAQADPIGKPPCADIWITSLGGDENAPGMLEGTILELLLKLRRLRHMFVSGDIDILPRVWVVFTAHSQVIENKHNRLGEPISPQKHLYSSRISMERIYNFVQTFFSDLADLFQCIEFPAYARMGSARLLFAGTWNFIPQQDRLSKKFEQMRGNVYDAADDPIQTLFGEGRGEVVAYAVRHVLSSGHVLGGSLAQTRVLCWAPSNTEPTFWVVAATAAQLWCQRGLEILSYIAYRCKAQHAMNQPELTSALHDIFVQLASLPSMPCERAQIGTDVPVLYYRHSDDPTMGEIVSEGRLALSRRAALLTGIRQRRIERMIAIYDVLCATIGETEYRDFLKKWNIRYNAFGRSDAFLVDHIEKRTEVVVMNEEARHLLNFWLH